MEKRSEESGERLVAVLPLRGQVGGTNFTTIHSHFFKTLKNHFIMKRYLHFAVAFWYMILQLIFS
jgi:hypothetical protein